ncbi:MAG: peptidyl-prolyl cis-trans isomerase [Archangiaceae bacterium]|nr:peptidyl-prolyl cis-trans isomerase [Archangiaceae bacterium]
MPTVTLKRLVREPLLHFAVVGGLIFAAQGLWRRGAPVGAPRLDVAAINAAQAELALELGRAPAPEELRLLEDRLVDEQLLFQEGVALGLDRSDAIVRRRIVQKMEFFAEDLRAGAAPTRAELAAYLAAHQGRYLRPERIWLHQVFFADRRPDARAAAERALVRLQRGEAVEADPFVLGAELKGRSRDELTSQLGPGVAQAALDAPQGTWVGPVQSAFGYHLLRVDERAPAQQASLDDVLATVSGDLTEERRQQARLALIADLRKKYRVGGQPAGAALLAPQLASEESR